MQVFKIYYKLMKKHMLSIILYGILFLGIMAIITFTVILQDGGKFNVKKVPILLVNNDEENEFINSFRSYLSNYVEFIEVKDDEDARKDSLFHHEIHYILTIPKGFTEELLNGEKVNLVKKSHPDRQDSARSVENAVNSYMNMASIYVKYNPDTDVKDLADFMSTYNLPDTEVIIDTKKKDTVESAEFNKYYFNYLGYIMITCFILSISKVLLSFHGIDIRRRQFASPISSRSFNMQLILANFIFVIAYVIIFFVVGYLCNPYRKFDAYLLLTWMNVLLFALTILCISYLIGITVREKNAVQALSTILSLSMAFISGMFVPQEFLGESVRRLSSFTPAFWYVKANNTICELASSNSESIRTVFQYMAIQIGFAAVFLSIILVAAKRKRQMAT